MDALRLLSRSTGLKLARQQKNSSAQHIPSEGQAHTPPEGQEPATTHGSVDSNRKRKRGPEDDDQPRPALTEDEIRALQAQHKIRIVNLRKLHKPNPRKSKKQHKETVRLFPPVLTDFAQLRQPPYKISSALDENIKHEGYRQPTEVQTATLPLLLSPDGEPADLLTVAPTGSGKTLAYLIPLIEQVRKRHHSEGPQRERRVQAVILAPTKELVSQIVNEARKLTVKTGVTVTEMRKGMMLSEHARVVDDDDDEEGEEKDAPTTMVKSDILVATPLSLVHSLTPSDSGSDSDPTVQLPAITTFVLDEADVLLDPLFRTQTLQIWSSLVSPALRVSLWSATIGSSIEELAMSHIVSRRRRLALPTKKPPIVRCVIGLKDASLPTISHRLVYAATEPGKLLGLRQLIHPSSASPTHLRPPFLIFTQTIARAIALHDELKFDIPAPAAAAPARIAVLHSDLSAGRRAEIMSGFRRGQIWILITTDLLSRGVDFRGVNGVVNYDIPTTAASYVHRAGRTGRAGRNGGVCVTLYTRDDIKYLRPIAAVIKASQSQSEDREGGIEPWMLDALPDVSKQERRELRERGVRERRAIKASDGADERRAKRKNRVGTKTGYDRRLEQKRSAMRAGHAARRWQQEEDGGGGGDDEFVGFE